MEGFYDIAGLQVRVRHNHGALARLCCDWRSSSVPPAGADTSFAEIDITPEDVAFERGKLTDSSGDANLESLAFLRLLAERAASESTVLFHSSSMLYKGKAYLFAAPSGTGKTTHCRLWKEVLGDSVCFLNGDKPFIKLTENGPIIFGTPWKGKEGYGINASAPVAGICFVRRGDKNSISAISHDEALPSLIRQTYRPRNTAELSAVMQSVIRLSSSVPLYSLSCNISCEAARLSFETMTGERLLPGTTEEQLSPP